VLISRPNVMLDESLKSHSSLMRYDYAATMHNDIDSNFNLDI